MEGACVDDIVFSPALERSERKFLAREVSDLSESSFLISSSPDAEKYFMKKIELLKEIAGRGELEVEVTEKTPSEYEELTVLPLEGKDEEIEILDLNAKPLLSVKDAVSSSFENLYDASLENRSGMPDLEKSAARSSFHATYQVPERVSSFENLYKADDVAMEEDYRPQPLQKGYNNVLLVLQLENNSLQLQLGV